MDPQAVATALKERLDTVVAGRGFAYPVATLTPPAAVVSYPEKINYDLTYGRGVDKIDDWPIIVVEGKVSDRSATERLYAYAHPVGPKSVKRALEQPGSAAWDDLQVTGCEFDVVTIAAVDYGAAIFHCTITGQGSR